MICSSSEACHTRLCILLACLAVLIFSVFGSSACTDNEPNRNGQTKALFIGNSLLTGNNRSGICASSPKRDYYALVNTELSKTHPGCSAERISGKAWEGYATSAEQDAYLRSIPPYLRGDLDFVVIQLGDNVMPGVGLPVLESGMHTFIDRVEASCPKARLVWVGCWWPNPPKKLTIGADVCATQGIPYVDAAPFNRRENQSEVGALVTYLDGKAEIVTDEAIASHPGDRGMALIADAIVSAVK